MKSVFIAKRLVFIFSFFILLSCGNGSDKPAGSPCSYKTKIYPAIVIGIEKKDSLHADVLFRIEDENGKLYRDSVSWYIENNNWILLADMDKDSLITGSKLRYKIDEIKTGDCNPRIEKLTLEKF